MAQLGFKSNTGVVREKNEDACFVIPSHDVYVVADGVGGNNAGEIASRTAVQGVAEYVTEVPITDCETDEEICSYFLDCITSINQQVYKLGHEHKENRGMATTIVLAYLHNDKAYIMNVGDSRAYLLRGDDFEQITEDHTYVNELVRSGAITKEEAETHHQRNVITRAIGAAPFVKTDFYRIPIQEGDILMLCSDGLYGEVAEQKIIEILKMDESMPHICGLLVDAAIEGGGRDNITVVCLKV